MRAAGEVRCTRGQQQLLQSGYSRAGTSSRQRNGLCLGKPMAQLLPGSWTCCEIQGYSGPLPDSCFFFFFFLRKVGLFGGAES